jgi:hypothetical protein
VLPGEIDLDRFETALHAARSTMHPDERARQLAEALATWRGDPLADLRYETFAQPEIDRLETLRIGVLEERLEADLAAGHHAEVLSELERSIASLRERLRGCTCWRSIGRAGRPRPYVPTRTCGVACRRLGIDRTGAADPRAADLAQDRADAPPVARLARSAGAEVGDGLVFGVSGYLVVEASTRWSRRRTRIRPPSGDFGGTVSRCSRTRSPDLWCRSGARDDANGRRTAVASAEAVAAR